MSGKKQRSPMVTILLWIGLIGYLLLLLRVILFKFDYNTIINILKDTDELQYTRVNLIPLQTIRFYLFSGRVSTAVAVRNIAGNILAFVPIGIFVPLLRRNLSLGTTFLIGFSLSAFIEITQYITGLGSCDIDDLLLNVIGTMLITLILALVDGICFLFRKIRKIIRKALDKS